MFDLIKKLVDFILHIDRHLAEIIADYGIWTYAILFAIIFAETGLDVHLMALLLFIAAVLGDTLNYWIGAKIGPAVFKRGDSFFLRKKHLERAHAFFEKYGGRAIILARFVPIVRTFVPFVAGVGQMTYSRFIAYNIIGGFIWITFFTYSGFWFGNQPFVQKNFKLVILAIIILSVLPIVFEAWRAWKESRLARAQA